MNSFANAADISHCRGRVQYPALNITGFDNAAQGLCKNQASFPHHCSISNGSDCSCARMAMLHNSAQAICHKLEQQQCISCLSYTQHIATGLGQQL